MVCHVVCLGTMPGLLTLHKVSDVMAHGVALTITYKLPVCESHSSCFAEFSSLSSRDGVKGQVLLLLLLLPGVGALLCPPVVQQGCMLVPVVRQHKL
jgi:hypothetical protein